VGDKGRDTLNGYPAYTAKLIYITLAQIDTVYENGRMSGVITLDGTYHIQKPGEIFVRGRGNDNRVFDGPFVIINISYFVCLHTFLETLASLHCINQGIQEKILRRAFVSVLLRPSTQKQW
jgi:hypothetical protein